MNTAANIVRSDSSHWYHANGDPCYELPKKDGKGTKVPTLADAKKLNLLPSVTTILKVLHKEALVRWLCEQTALAVLTTPRLPDESEDAFVTRVLSVEKHQDAEAKKARELGSSGHDALELVLAGQPYAVELEPYVKPVMDEVSKMGRLVWSEKILVGNGYAGRADALFQGDALTLVDFKTAKKLPKDSWDEHKMQLAAYARIVGNTASEHIRTCNIYISTTEPGQIAVCTQDDWMDTYQDAFYPLLKYWQWQASYQPTP